MTSISKHIDLDAPAVDVWAAVRDFGALHERLAPGFVTDCHLDGTGARNVTFFNGGTAREMLVGIDDPGRRLAYSIVESRFGFTHHNAAVSVDDEGDGRSRLTWTCDLLPDAVADPVAAMMDLGLTAVRDHVGRARGTIEACSSAPSSATGSPTAPSPSPTASGRDQRSRSEGPTEAAR
jgi:hypothetical protein